MKKFLLLAALAASSLTTLAQNKVSYGIVGNLNLSQLNTSYNFEGMKGSDNTSTLVSFSAGAFADLGVSQTISIRPTLLYSGKGGRLSQEGVTAKVMINYLELPLDVVYHLPVKYGEWHFGLGPYFGYGLSAKISAKEDGTSMSQDVEFGDTDDTYRRNDAGINFLVGLRLNNRLLLNLGSDWGLANISNQDGVKTRNLTSTIGIGYAF